MIDSEIFAVLSPEGVERGPVLVQAERLPSLRNKRVAFLWDHMFRGEEMFAEIAVHLQQVHGAMTLGHQAFGNIHGENEEEVVAQLPEVLRAERVDAVIAAVGA